MPDIQIQVEVAGADAAARDLDDLSNSIKDTGNESETAQGKIGTLGSKFSGFKSNLAGVVGSFTALSGAILGLAHDFESLNSASIRVESANRRVETTAISVQKAWDKYNDAVKKFGPNSKEAQEALAKLRTAQEGHEIAIKKAEQAQSSYNLKLTEFATDIGPQILGVVGSIVGIFSSLSGKTKAAADEAATSGTKWSSLGGIIAKVAIPLAAIGAAYVILKENIGGSRTALEKFGDQLGKAVPALQPLLKVIGDIGNGLLGLPGGFKNLNADLKALSDQLAPIFNILKQKFDEMFHAAQTFIKQLTSGDLVAALNTLVASATKLGTDIVNAIKSVDWSQVWQGLKDAWTSTVQWFANVGTNLATSITNSIKTTDWNAVGQSIITGIISAMTFSDEVIRIILSRFTAAWKTAAEGYDWKSTTDVITNHMKSSLDSNIQGFTAIGQSILTGIQNVMSGKGGGGAAATDWGPVGNAIVNGISDGTKSRDWSPVGRNILAAMQATLKTNIEGFSAIGQAILDGIIAAIVQLGNAAAAFGQAISDKITQGLTQLKVNFSQAAQAILDGIISAIVQLGNAAAAFAQAIGDKITAGVQQLKVDFSAAGQKILDGIIAAIVQLGNAAAAFAQAIGDKVKAGLDQLRVDAATAAQKVFDGLVTAIVNLPNAAAAFAQAVGDKIKSGIEQAIKNLTSTDFTKAAQDLWGKFTKAISDFFGGQSAKGATGGGSNILQDVNILQGQTITMKLALDTTAATTALAALKTKVDALTSGQKTIQITANTGPAASAIGALQNNISAMTTNQHIIQITANTGPATSALSTLQSVVTQLTSAQKIIQITANTGPATSALSTLQSVVTQLTSAQKIIQITANTGPAASALGALQNTVTALTGSQHIIQITANTGPAASAIGALQNTITAMTGAQHIIQITANTGPAASAIGALQNTISALTGAQHIVQITANTGPATSAIQQVQNLVTQLTQRQWIIQITANTGPATSAIQQLQNVVSQLVSRQYSINITANTAQAQQAISALQAQLNALRAQGAATGVPIGFARTGGLFELTGGGFRRKKRGDELHAAQGGAFIISKETRLGNLTVGEGNKPEMLQFTRARGGRGVGMLMVTPIKVPRMPRLHAQGGGFFFTPGSPNFGGSAPPTPGGFEQSGGQPQEYNIPAPVQTIGQGGPQQGMPSEVGAGTILVGPGGQAVPGPVTAPPGGGPGGGFGGLIPGAPSGGATTILPQTGLPQEYNQPTAAQQGGGGTVQTTPMPSTGAGANVSPYQMANLTGQSVAKEMEPAQRQMQHDMASLLVMIRRLLRQIMTRDINANLMIDGQKMASTVSKYIGSGAYGGR